MAHIKYNQMKETQTLLGGYLIKIMDGMMKQNKKFKEDYGKKYLMTLQMFIIIMLFHGMVFKDL